MNTHTIYKLAAKLFLGSALYVALNPVMALPAQAPAQVPMSVGASGTIPNIMLMVDNSGSMANTLTVPKVGITPSQMPAGTTYSCANPIVGGSSTATAATIYMTISSLPNGTLNLPKICTSNSSCDTSNQFSFSQKCFNNNQYYNVTFVTPPSTIGATLPGGPFLGRNLNWYFDNPKTIVGDPINGIHGFQAASAKTLETVASTNTYTRTKMAKDAATNVVNSFEPKSGASPVVRMGLSDYDGEVGGELVTPIKDLDATQATTLRTGISNASGTGVTPLATTLVDIGRYFTIGETGNLTLHPNKSNATSASINSIFGFDINSTADNPLNLSWWQGEFSGAAPNGLKNVTSATAAPITSYCQKNYAILISDGLPNYDRPVSNYLRNYSGECDTATNKICDSTPNATSLAGIGTALTATGTGCSSSKKWGNIACQNGTKAGSVYETGGSDYIDDVAQALFEMDLRPTCNWGSNMCKSSAKPTGFISNIKTYAIGIADTSVDWNKSVLKQAAVKGGTGESGFQTAFNAEALAKSLDTMMTGIIAGAGSFSATVANATQLNASSALFQATYDTTDWTGSFRVFPVDSTGTVQAAAWEAGTLIPSYLSRNIFTYNNTATGNSPKGISFKGTAASGICSQLTQTQRTALGIAAPSSTINCTNSNDQGVWRLDWLRGDISHEVINTIQQTTYNATSTPSDPRATASYNSTTAPVNNLFRNRARFYTASTALGSSHLAGDLMAPDPWVLGDIVNSDPTYVSNENYGYAKLTSAEGSSVYTNFVTSKASWRKMVYIGANDGMLHGFDASTTGTDGGKEMLAYLPNAVFDSSGVLTNLSSPTFNHQYTVDGSPKVGDAYWGSSWHTVLVGSMGAGGRGIFALDVTDPDSFSTSDVLWEISDTDAPITADKASFAANLGYSLPQASIGKMHDGSWAAIIANGYASASGRAVLYLVNIQTGGIITSFDTLAGDPTNTPNGLSTPIAVDVDSDSVIDAIYAGDLLGNMWKFDVSSSDKKEWKIAYGTSAPAPLYIACIDSTNCNNTRQPITNKPQVGKVKAPQTTGVMVYFGTGKYFETVDNNITNTAIQSFYGIWDECPLIGFSTTASTCNTVAKTSLLKQTIIDEQTVPMNIRLTSNNSINYPTEKGWYINFVKPTTGVSVGERIVSASLLRGGRIIFTTLTPNPVIAASTDPCSVQANSSSWLMELDANSGSRFSSPVLDINQSGTINSLDMVNYTAGGTTKSVAPSGVQLPGGSSKTPAILTNPTTGTEFKGFSDSTGKSLAGSKLFTEQGAGQLTTPVQRQSWRQL
jgi:type IV pilus assembly protein PilY1